MKTQILNYTFDKTAKQITFTDYASIRLDQILLITNVTRNVIIYNFADPTKGGTVATNVLTLAYDTNSQNNNDKLLIYYDDPNYQVEGSTQDAAVTTDTTGSLSAKLRGLVKIFADVWDSTHHWLNVSIASALSFEDTTTNAARVERTYTEVGSLSVASAANLLNPTDVSIYTQVNLQVINVGSNVLTVYGSNDNSNYKAIQILNPTTGQMQGTIVADGIYIIPVHFRWVKVLVTTYTTGTITGVAELVTVSPGYIGIKGLDAFGNLILTGGAISDADGKTFPAPSPVSAFGFIYNAATGKWDRPLVAPTTIYENKKTVTTAGTRVALATTQAIKSITIKALNTNTGIIYVGDSAVASTNGFQLNAGETISLDIADLATVYIDSSVNGEGVTYIAVN